MFLTSTSCRVCSANSTVLAASQPLNANCVFPHVRSSQKIICGTVKQISHLRNLRCRNSTASLPIIVAFPCNTDFFRKFFLR
nr:MAG TPA: hypothetical protein [Caudoviricetes sp.]